MSETRERFKAHLRAHPNEIQPMRERFGMTKPKASLDELFNEYERRRASGEEKPITYRDAQAIEERAAENAALLPKWQEQVELYERALANHDRQLAADLIVRFIRQNPLFCTTLEFSRLCHRQDFLDLTNDPSIRF